MTDDDRIDFTPLDPGDDPARFDRLVRAIAAGAAGEMARRRARVTPLGEVARWRRPVLAAAATILVAALAALTRVGGPGVDDAGEDSTLAEAIGVPSSLAASVLGDTLPSPAQLLLDASGIDR